MASFSTLTPADQPQSPAVQPQSQAERPQSERDNYLEFERTDSGRVRTRVVGKVAVSAVVGAVTLIALGYLLVPVPIH